MKSILVIIGIFVFLSSCIKEECGEINDLVAVQTLANNSEWIPLLKKRDTSNPELKLKLFDLMSLISNFRTNIIIEAGGFDEKSLLINPNSDIRLSAIEMKAFYSELKEKLDEMKKNTSYSILVSEMNPLLEFTFLNENGMLSSSNLATSSVVIASSRLLMMENYFYYLIVKYT